ncbi:MAG TPA: EF-hand domain-containing protein [Caulobacteraceae bacterium]|nr:EF-hand domain-containing protein [Caulobacteraceae bacterium]
MRRLMLLALAGALAAGPALGAPTPVPAPRPAIFLSPSGEPFRAAPGRPSPFDAWFDQADTNHDGFIDLAEFRADALRFFRRLDTDGDGVIDGFEVQAYESDIAPELIASYEGPVAGLMGPPQHGRKHGKRGAGPPIQRLIDEAEPVSGADFNLDGKITLAEWMRATDARFRLLDVGRTGRLGRAALEARLAASRKHGARVG